MLCDKAPSHTAYAHMCTTVATPAHATAVATVCKARASAHVLPACVCVAGWRDPFVLERPSASSPWWYVMIGSGVRNTCGTALVYRSKDLTKGGRQGRGWG